MQTHCAAQPIRLDVGCGTDIRERFINIDGSHTLDQTDLIMDFETQTLREHFAAVSATHGQRKRRRPPCGARASALFTYAVNEPILLLRVFYAHRIHHNNKP